MTLHDLLVVTLLQPILACMQYAMNTALIGESNDAIKPILWFPANCWHIIDVQVQALDSERHAWQG